MANLKADGRLGCFDQTIGPNSAIGIVPLKWLLCGDYMSEYIE